MGAFQIAIILGFISVIIIAGLASKSSYLKQAYFAGVETWLKWLPVAAALLFMFTIGINLVLDTPKIPKAFGLFGYFSELELIFLFLIAPVFLARFGFLIAACILTYIAHRLMTFETPPPDTLGTVTLVASLTIVGILGDKMPWHNPLKPNLLAQKFRDTIHYLLCFGALGILLIALFNVSQFAHWTTWALSLNFSSTSLIAFLIILLIGWFSVILGFFNNLLIPSLILPSLIVLAFVTKWPVYFLAVPFVACMALSFVIGDRRIANI